MVKNIQDNIASIRKFIPPSVTLVAVSKTFDTNHILEAYQCGQRDFGENRVQELQDKAQSLKSLHGIRWHFIGHLQSNKVKSLLSVPNLYMVHSVDTAKLAHRMNQNLKHSGRILRVLIQVNTSNEQSKYGCSKEDLLKLSKEVANLPNLRLNGLMTIAKLEGTEIENRACFSTLKSLMVEFVKSSDVLNAMTHLSMGMSSDYRIAVSEGSTMIRIGQDIFGNRSTPNSVYWPEK
ncbi:hypothetical protein TDB9533_03335 [Thalassocella blandensis]|nr:hypothetical protein TDB9533_03335 [Thalassocella blandensis]